MPIGVALRSDGSAPGLDEHRLPVRHQAPVDHGDDRLEGPRADAGPAVPPPLEPLMAGKRGIEPVDEIDFRVEGDHAAVRHAERVRPLRGRFRGSALTTELERERAEDRRRDDTP
jgi:hypothetical protein